MYRGNMEGKIPPSVEVCICGSSRKRDRSSLLFTFHVSSQIRYLLLDPLLTSLSCGSCLLSVRSSLGIPHPSPGHSACTSLITASPLWAVILLKCRETLRAGPRTVLVTAVSPASPNKGPDTKWVLSKDLVNS